MMENKSEQIQLIREMPSENVGEYPISLWMMIEDFRDHTLVIPPFQRGRVWPSLKIKDWGKSVINKQALGVLVTYQINGSGAKFLADGLQRMYATLDLLDSPQSFGLSYDRQQMERFVRTFRITVQHRHYGSHTEAMVGFQNLNKGTSADPYEYYHGVMGLDPRGMEVVDHVGNILRSRESSLFDVKNREREHKLMRDAYALFHQFISGTDRKSWAGIGSSQIASNDKPVEQVLTDYFDEFNLTVSDIRGWLSRFETFVNEHYAELEKLVNFKAGCSPTLARYILHVDIWSHNTKKKPAIYRDFVTKLFGHLSAYSVYPSRFVLPNTEPLETISLQFGTMRTLTILSRALQVDWEESPPRRKKQMAVRPGYHESHLLPFSEYGNGETVEEPARWNRQRGARPMSEDEVAILIP